MKLNLAETFTSIQGEGLLTGTRMFFIRFGGCTVTSCVLHPVNGGLCDENWRVQSTVSGVDGLERLAQLAFDEVGDGGWVCITGGEPLEQKEPLSFLCDELHRKGLWINLQTSGTRSVDGIHVDWLTVSPKCHVDELEQTDGDELKLVFTHQPIEELRGFYEKTRFMHYQLQPLWNQDECTNMNTTISAIHRAARNGMEWALSLQAHKFMGVR